MKLADIDHLFISYEVIELPQDGVSRNPDWCSRLGKKLCPGEYTRPYFTRNGRKIPWEKRKYTGSLPWLKWEPVHIRIADYQVCIYVKKPELSP